MITRLIDLTEGLFWLARRINPLERWRAAQDGMASPGGYAWVWLLVIVFALTVLAMVGWGLAIRIDNRRKSGWHAFNRRADELGLSDEERNLLYNIAMEARVDRLTAIFTSLAAFNRGVAAIAAQKPPSGLFARYRVRMCGSCALIYSLREKLGFQMPTGQSKPTSVRLGNVPQGTILAVLRQRSPESFEVSCAGCNSRGELLVEPEMTIDCHPGESWVVRYPEGGVLWEFNAWVVRTIEGKVALKPVGSLRWLNRRRFVRTPTRRVAHVAAFPFRRDGEVTVTPEFVKARLLEIAGTGVKISAPMEVAVGDRVLIVLQMQARKAIEALGIVRHSGRQADGTYVFGAELTGLTTPEVAELAMETNVALHDGAEEPHADAQLVGAAEGNQI